MAQARRPVALAIGYFDPYFAAHARRLRELREVHPDATLAVLVADRENSLLDRRARAEMVAALRCVDIVLTEGDPTTLRPDHVIDLRTEDEALAADLRRRVLTRGGNRPA